MSEKIRSDRLERSINKERTVCCNLFFFQSFSFSFFSPLEPLQRICRLQELARASSRVESSRGFVC